MAKSVSLSHATADNSSARQIVDNNQIQKFLEVALNSFLASKLASCHQNEADFLKNAMLQDLAKNISAFIASVSVSPDISSIFGYRYDITSQPFTEEDAKNKFVRIVSADITTTKSMFNFIANPDGSIVIPISRDAINKDKRSIHDILLLHTKNDDQNISLNIDEKFEVLRNLLLELRPYDIEAFFSCIKSKDFSVRTKISDTKTVITSFQESDIPSFFKMAITRCDIEATKLLLSYAIDPNTTISAYDYPQMPLIEYACRNLTQLKADAFARATTSEIERTQINQLETIIAELIDSGARCGVVVDEASKILLMDLTTKGALFSTSKYINSEILGYQNALEERIQRHEEQARKLTLIPDTVWNGWQSEQAEVESINIIARSAHAYLKDDKITMQDLVQIYSSFCMFLQSQLRSTLISISAVAGGEVNSNSAQSALSSVIGSIPYIGKTIANKLDALSTYEQLLRCKEKISHISSNAHQDMVIRDYAVRVTEFCNMDILGQQSQSVINSVKSAFTNAIFDPRKEQNIKESFERLAEKFVGAFVSYLADTEVTYDSALGTKIADAIIPSWYQNIDTIETASKHQYMASLAAIASANAETAKFLISAKYPDSDITFIERDGLFSCVIANAENINIVFGAEKSPKHYLALMNPAAAIMSLRVKTDTEIETSYRLKVHRAIYRFFENHFSSKDAIKDTLNKALQQYPCAKISITGYSMGGAMASLSYLKTMAMMGSKGSMTELYTFGEPRWCDKNSLNEARSIMQENNCHRIVNESDIMTKMPPVTAGFVHVNDRPFEMSRHLAQDGVNLARAQELLNAIPRLLVTSVSSSFNALTSDAKGALDEHAIESYLVNLESQDAAIENSKDEGRKIQEYVDEQPPRARTMTIYANVDDNISAHEEANESRDAVQAPMPNSSPIAQQVALKEEVSAAQKWKETQATKAKTLPPLHAAIKACDIAETERLIKDGANLLENSRDGTPLIIAIRSKNDAIIKLLFKQGATTPLQQAIIEYSGDQDLGSISALMAKPEIAVTLNDKNHLGYTALHIAVCYGSLDIAKLFLSDEKIDPNLWDADGFTAFHLAAHNGKLDIVKLFLSDQRIDTNLTAKSSWTSLHLAVERGHADIVETLLSDRRIDPHLKDRYDRTALHFAAIHGHRGIVELLLSDGRIDPTLENKRGFTALHLAAEYGHIGIAEALLNDKRIDPSLRTAGGDTALYIATEGDYPDIVKLLLSDARVDPNLRYTGDWTALHIAAKRGYLDVVKLLLSDKRIDPNLRSTGDRTALHLAAANGHLSVVKLLLGDTRIDPNLKDKDDNTALHIAAWHGHLDIVKLLLGNERVDPNLKDKDNNTALHIAAGNGHLDIVKLLLGDERVDPNLQEKYGDTALHFVANEGYLDIAEALLSDPRVTTHLIDKYDNTALHIASNEGHSILVKLFLDDKRIDPNLKGKGGNTAIYFAAASGHLDIVKLLLDDKRVDPNLGNEHSDTALHLAVINGHLDIVKLLLGDTRVDPNLKDTDGWTSLHLAVIEDYRDGVELLLSDTRVHPDLRDQFGDTALYDAAKRGYLAVVKLLLSDTRVDPNLRSTGDRTALHIASENGYIDIVKLLLSSTKTDPNVQAKNKETPLMTAIKKGAFQVVVTLLQDERIDIAPIKDSASKADDRATVISKYIKNLVSEGKIEESSAYEALARVKFTECKKSLKQELDGKNVSFEDHLDLKKISPIAIDFLRQKSNAPMLEVDFKEMRYIIAAEATRPSYQKFIELASSKAPSSDFIALQKALFYYHLGNFVETLDIIEGLKYITPFTKRAMQTLRALSYLSLGQDDQTLEIVRSIFGSATIGVDPQLDAEYEELASYIEIAVVARRDITSREEAFESFKSKIAGNKTIAGEYIALTPEINGFYDRMTIAQNLQTMSTNRQRYNDLERVLNSIEKALTTKDTRDHSLEFDIETARDRLQEFFKKSALLVATFDSSTKAFVSTLNNAILPAHHLLYPDYAEKNFLRHRQFPKALVDAQKNLTTSHAIFTKIGELQEKLRALSAQIQSHEVHKIIDAVIKYYDSYATKFCDLYGNDAYKAGFKDTEQYVRAITKFASNGSKLKIEVPNIPSHIAASKGLYRVFIGNDDPIYLKADATEKLGLDDESVTSSSRYGQHSVASYQGIHFKRSPYAPGIEFAVGALNRMIMQESSMPTRILKLEGVSGNNIGKDLLYIASPTISGENLHMVLSNPEYIKLIDIDSFSSAFISSLVIGSGDAKPDNFIARFIKNGNGDLDRVEIVSIDNDIAFARGRLGFKIANGKSQLYSDMLNVLFFFPQMDMVISHTLRELFTYSKYAAEEIMINWLKAIADQNAEYMKLAEAGFTQEDIASLKLPISLPEGAASLMYERLKNIGDMIILNPDITHSMLLRSFYPGISQYYQQHRTDDSIHSIRQIYIDAAENQEIATELASTDRIKSQYGWKQASSSKCLDDKAFGERFSENIEDASVKFLEGINFANVTGVALPTFIATKCSHLPKMRLTNISQEQFTAMVHALPQDHLIREFIIVTNDEELWETIEHSMVVQRLRDEHGIQISCDEIDDYNTCMTSPKAKNSVVSSFVTQSFTKDDAIQIPDKLQHILLNLEQMSDSKMAALIRDTTALIYAQESITLPEELRVNFMLMLQDYPEKLGSIGAILASKGFFNEDSTFLHIILNNSRILKFIEIITELVQASPEHLLIKDDTGRLPYDIVMSLPNTENKLTFLGIITQYSRGNPKIFSHLTCDDELIIRATKYGFIPSKNELRTHKYDFTKINPNSSRTILQEAVQNANDNDLLTLISRCIKDRIASNLDETDELIKMIWEHKDNEGETFWNMSLKLIKSASDAIYPLISAIEDIYDTFHGARYAEPPIYNQKGAHICTSPDTQIRYLSQIFSAIGWGMSLNEATSGSLHPGTVASRTDERGSSALHALLTIQSATLTKYGINLREAVKFLMELGVSPHSTLRGDGLTPCDIATRHQDTDTLAIFNDAISSQDEGGCTELIGEIYDGL